MLGRAASLAFILAVSGCALFGCSRQTPQQKFLDALNRGNSAEASQIWLTMTPEDRNKFQRGQAMTPGVSPQELTKTLDEQGASTDQGPITIGPHSGASLLDLPSAAGSPPPSEGAR